MRRFSACRGDGSAIGGSCWPPVAEGLAERSGEEERRGGWARRREVQAPRLTAWGSPEIGRGVEAAAAAAAAAAEDEEDEEEDEEEGFEVVDATAVGVRGGLVEWLVVEWARAARSKAFVRMSATYSTPRTPCVGWRQSSPTTSESEKPGRFSRTNGSSARCTERHACP
jgi:hypothetical protein